MVPCQVEKDILKRFAHRAKFVESDARANQRRRDPWYILRALWIHHEGISFSLLNYTSQVWQESAGDRRLIDLNLEPFALATA